MTIQEITETLIDTEVKYLLESKESIEWVEETYTSDFCEEVMYATLDGHIEGQGIYAFVLSEMLNRYFDEFIDSHYIAEEVKNRFISKKKNPPIIQDNTGYYRTIKAQ